MKKLISSIFISLSAVLLMSHNTFAEVTYNNNIRFVKRLNTNALYYATDATNFTWGQGWFVFSRGQKSNFFRLSNSGDNFIVKNNQIVVVSGEFYATSTYASTINTSGMMFISDMVPNCPLVDLSYDTSEMQNETGSSQITYRQAFTATCVMAADTSTRVAINLGVENSSPSGSPSNIGINFTSLYVFERDTSLYDIYNWLQNNSDDAGDTLKQEKQDVQDASDNSESTAESSSDNQATTTLSNNLNNIFSTISSIQASNCIIAGNLGHINMGNINLCQGKEYFNQLFEFIGYTTLFTVCFWAAYHLINRTIRLIDWARS